MKVVERFSTAYYGIAHTGASPNDKAIAAAILVLAESLENRPLSEGCVLHAASCGEANPGPFLREMSK